MYEFIPEELKKLKNWVCWKAIPDSSSHSGISKIPINPYTGGKAMSSNPDTWSDFDTAVRVSADLAGIGFMFGNSGYMGVDLDDMPQALDDYKSGKKDNVVAEFVYALKSYTELSQSKNGIHIICRGKLPPGRRKIKNEYGGFEMYDSGRFFVMTGDCCSEFTEIADGTETIKPLHEKYLADKKKTPARAENMPPVPLSLSANEIIEKARSSQNGAKFEALYKGDISGYASQSEADMAFCNILAFWCGGDISTMDAIYRSSGLMRDKWDRKQSGSTYGMLTLKKAAESCNNAYSPQSSYNDYCISIGARKQLPKKLYSFDDTGNAERMFDYFGDILKYSYVDKRWLYYRDGKWTYDNVGEVHRIADAALEVMKKEGLLWEEHEGGIYYDDFKKHLKRTRSYNTKKAMVKELEHRVPILPKNMDTDRMSVNCKNGIIDLHTGKLTSHDINKFMTKMLNVELPDAPKPPALWLNFLNDIFGGDRELIRYIQKAVGYSLSGSTSEQCVFFLYGTGRNGKSTFLEIIRYIMGDYATNIQPETIMVRPSQGSANSDIARLKGARFVTSVEPNEGMRINEGLLKQLTGDDVVTARKLYGDEFEFKPEFKLWMATNHKPIIRGTDTGIWRRIHIIPFTVSIPAEKVDRQLKYKLRKELPDILAWAVKGCLLWQAEGLSMPKAVLDAVQEYRHEMDVISAFADACCITGGEAKASQLYAVYAEWAGENNEYCMSSTKFGAEMAKRFERVKKRDGLYYSGITISPEHGYSVSIG